MRAQLADSTTLPSNLFTFVTAYRPADVTSPGETTFNQPFAKQLTCSVRFQVLTADSIKLGVFGHDAPRSVVETDVSEMLTAKVIMMNKPRAKKANE
jgi:hypothetical protein